VQLTFVPRWPTATTGGKGYEVLGSKTNYPFRRRSSIYYRKY